MHIEVYSARGIKMEGTFGVGRGQTFRSLSDWATVHRGGGTVEIFFLHYHSEDDARAKWERRCKRVNWEHMLVKFNDQNGGNLDKFLQMPYSKLFFACKKWNNMNQDCYVIHQPPSDNGIT